MTTPIGQSSVGRYCIGWVRSLGLKPKASTRVIFPRSEAAPPKCCSVAKTSTCKQTRLNNSDATGIRQAVSGDRLFIFIFLFSHRISLFHRLTGLLQGSQAAVSSSPANRAPSQGLAMTNAGSPLLTLTDRTSSERRRNHNKTLLLVLLHLLLCCCGIWPNPVVTSHLHTHKQVIK